MDIDREAGMALLEKVEVTSVKEKRQTDWTFLPTDALPWTPWAMPGTFFKLLNISEETGRFTFLLKVEPGAAPVHKHLGLAEGYILEGEFGYGEDRGAAGCYTRELAGATHIPDTRSGMTMLAISHGPIAGYNQDGSIAGLIDVDWMYDMAAANGAAGHIKRMNAFENE
jgi:2,4'-dihydroxyacetophenone dioxygenase